MFEYVQLQHWIAFVVVVFLSIVAYSFIHCDDNEQPVPFHVPLPEQSKPGWQGEILEKPSIKVNRRSTFSGQKR